MSICQMCGHDHAERPKRPQVDDGHEHQWRISGQTVNCRICLAVQDTDGMAHQ